VAPLLKRKSGPMQPTPALLHSAFYGFVPLADPEATAHAVRTCAAGLMGSIVLAFEGISGTVSGSAQAVAAFEAALKKELASPEMQFKHSACTTAPFGRLKVSVKPEIVALGLPNSTDLPAPDEHDSSHLSPQAWRDMLASGSAVVLDNRNHFEYRLGHFKGALDASVHNFRDFVAYVLEHAPSWRAADKPVAMYCTGGIRCDKTAPWLRSLGLQVLQLDGGILNYLHTMPDAQHDWVGECFVFDNRVALNTALEETNTTAQQVFDSQHPDEAWRLRRALQLDQPNS
jgi:UPF0176 protein